MRLVVLFFPPFHALLFRLEEALEDGGGEGLTFKEAFPGRRNEGIKLAVDVPSNKLGSEINPSRVVAHSPVPLSLPVLTHHDDGCLKGRQTRQAQIQQDERVGVPRGIMKKVDDAPDENEAAKTRQKLPGPSNFGYPVREPA